MIPGIDFAGVVETSSHPNFISMPGMHGSYAANMAMTDTDLLIALGARFDDRVTGRLDAFADRVGIAQRQVRPAHQATALRGLSGTTLVLASARRARARSMRANTSRITSASGSSVTRKWWR